MNPSEPVRETSTSGSQNSYWIESVTPLIFQPLTENLETDVVIVGGGIAGLSVGYALAKRNVPVVIVEDGLIGSGESGRTTAHLVNALDDRFYSLEKIFGKEGAQMAAESHSAAIDFIEDAVITENIECGFDRLDGFLFLHPTDDRDSLERELKASREAGLNVEMLSYIPGMKGDTGPCLKFPRQAQFHILKYLNGIAQSILKRGGKIFTGTHAKDIDHTGIVTDKGFIVKAKHVVVATNSPVNDRFVIHTKQAPYRTYVIGATMKRGVIPKALWWDTGDHKINSAVPPYHYVRLHAFDENYDLLICGGEDHPTGKLGDRDLSEAERYAALERWTRERFPIEHIIYQWSGQVMETMDSLAYIGRNPMDKNNVYIVTGDSGNGMTHGTIAGILIADLITGVENKWEKLYDPSRFKLFSSGGAFIKEAFSVLGEYLKDFPGHHDVNGISDIPIGEGRVMEIRGEKIGVFRDKENHLHIVSAVCTHLKCIVTWNKAECSWDCPCHGSRFTPDGKVMNGPANSDLPFFKTSVPIKLEKK